MPIGKTFKGGYGASSQYGLCYREIAERMTATGDKMNHSTARNVLLRALEKLAIPLTNMYTDSDFESLDPSVIVKDPSFQEGIIAVLHNIYD